MGGNSVQSVSLGMYRTLGSQWSQLKPTGLLESRGGSFNARLRQSDAVWASL